MQIKHFLNVKNRDTASHYKITLQQKVVGWRMSYKKVPVQQKWWMAAIHMSVTLGGNVYEMTRHIKD